MSAPELGLCVRMANSSASWTPFDRSRNPIGRHRNLDRLIWKPDAAGVTDELLAEMYPFNRK